MNRRSDDEFTLPPHGALPATTADRMPCNRCGTPTLRSTLNHYGARCFECYRSWCNEPQTRPYVGDKATDGPKAWAHALKAREEAGERLSLGQRTMWRDALHLPITGAIASWEQTPEDFANGAPILREEPTA